MLGHLVDNDTSKNQEGQANSSGRKKDEDLRPWIENMKKWMKAQVAKEGYASRFDPDGTRMHMTHRSESITQRQF